MSKLKLKNKQDIEDFVRGCTFYATGGGGIPANGIESLVNQMEKGVELQLTDVNDLADDAVAACPFLMGSIAPHTDEIKKEMQGFGFVEVLNLEKDRLAKAVLELEKYTGKKIDAIIPIELAGANTSGAIAAALSLGKLAIDGDYTGRAIPEIQQTTPYLNGKEIMPITSVDAWGNVCTINNAINYRVAERIGKFISAAAYGLAGQAGFLMTGKEVKETIIPGTLTESYELGKFIRETRESGKPVVEEIVRKLDGYLLITGRITEVKDKDKDGYYWGINTINGIDKFEGDTLKIWFKNENHICWKNDTPIVTSPDIITVVDLETGEPVPNPLLEVGKKVAAIGLKARPQFRSKAGIDILGPKYFGFDIDYVPIEESLK